MIEKTLEQLIDELKQLNKKANDIGDHIESLIRPGTILQLAEPLMNNFEMRQDKELDEEDFRYAVIVLVPSHGYSLMDIEGNLIKEKHPEGPNVRMIAVSDEDLDSKTMKEIVSEAQEQEEMSRVKNPDDLDEEDVDSCALGFSDPVSLVTEHPGMIVGHISDYLVKFKKGR